MTTVFVFLSGNQKKLSYPLGSPPSCCLIPYPVYGYCALMFVDLYPCFIRGMSAPEFVPYVREGSGIPSHVCDYAMRTRLPCGFGVVSSRSPRHVIGTICSRWQLDNPWPATCAASHLAAIVAMPTSSTPCSFLLHMRGSRMPMVFISKSRSDGGSRGIGMHRMRLALAGYLLV